ncbi:MAG: hypothetical protein DRI37_08100 [Chloroflexi bacterium]|nr:MAG: hypothetical protein DRI37_08100 [Chloroflexota bacterium]
MKRGLLLLWLLLCASCAAPAIVPTPTGAPLTATPEPLQVVCAESLEPLCRTLASAYQRENPLVQVVLVERADTLAWQALEQGDAAVAALTWLPPEQPAGWWQAIFARDGLAIVVNRQNGLPGLTVGQLRELFQGRVEDWGPWGGLPGIPQVISREEASGDYALFQEQVMGDFPVALTAFLAPGSEAVLEMVAEDQLAVGYLSTARLDEERVRPLAIEEVPPVPEALASDLYPLTRDLYLVTPEEPQGVTRDFVQWILGPEGQAIVRRQGWLLP